MLHRPEAVDAAVELLARLGDEAKVLAGGQSLVPLMNMRLARPAHLVDINRLGGLDRVETDGGWLLLGATARTARVERAEVVRQGWPVLAAALHEVGHFQIRNRGTAAGSVAHADPAAELPAVLVALDGEVVTRSQRGERRHRARDFFTGVFTTLLEPDELIVELRVPPISPGVRTGFAEVARRHGDFAIAGAVAVEHAGGDAARVVLFGVSDRPVEVDVPGRLGAEETERFVHEQLQEVRGDIHASPETRRRVAAAVAAEAVRRAA